MAALLALAGIAGWAGGQLWWRWWAPGPEGTVHDTGSERIWLPEPLESGFAEIFPATAQYVVIGLGFGLVLGILAGVAFRGRELVGLAGGMAAAVIGAVAMYAVGMALSPPDPQTLVDDVRVGAALPAALGLGGWPALLAWPIGVTAGFLAVMVLAPVPSPDAGNQSMMPPPPHAPHVSRPSAF